MAQDFGINPQLGLSLAQMASPEDRAMAQAKLADVQTQVQERKNAAQKTGLENQQLQTKLGGEAAVRKMLQDKQAAGQDPTAADFLVLLGPNEGTKAAQAWANKNKADLDNHKLQIENMQKGIDTIANGAVAMRAEHDPMKRAAMRDQIIELNSPSNGGTVDPKLLDNFAKNGLTDTELDTLISQSIPAQTNALAIQKQKTDDAQKKLDSDYKLVTTRQKERELNQKDQEIANTAAAAQSKPTEVSPGAILRYPPNSGIPDFTAPAAAKPEVKPTDQERYAQLYVKVQNGTATPDEKTELAGLKERATLAGTNTFNLSNPKTSDDTVKSIVDQIEQDSTGQLLTKLTTGNKTLQNQVRDEIAKRGTDLRILTPATRQLGETAHTLMPDFDKTLTMLNSPTLQKKMDDVVGPRWQEFLAGTVGKGDPEFDRLRTFVSLLQTGTMRAHVGARGSAGMASKFENLFNANKMDAATLRDALTATKEFLHGYDDAVYGKNAKVGTGGPSTADEYLKSIGH